MKKISAIILCCLLVVALIALPVMAAQTATFTVAASKTSVKRGDTITVTVSTTVVENCNNIGLSLKIDTDVFEYVSGTCKLTGGMMAGVNYKNGSADCYWVASAGSAVQGAMYEVTLRVKDDAAFGASQITSAKAQAKDPADVACTANNVTVTVTCDHPSYTDWAADGTENHKKTCTECGEPKTEAHKWNSGEVTDRPSCNTPGVKTLTCTVCSATKTEAVAATGEHTYGAWEKNDKDTHKTACTGCGTPKTEAHKWNSGNVTAQPDCANAGVKTYTCTVCSETETEAVPSTGEHGYGNWTKLDDEKHTRSCTGCGGATQTENHTMDAGVVTKPANCKETGIRTYTCTASGCGHSYTEVIPTTDDHSYGAWTSLGADKHQRVCSVCGNPETAAHEFATELTEGETTHWYACVCGAKKGETEHAYDENKWAHDDEGHYRSCECGAEKADSKVAHNWDEGVVTLKPTTKKEGEKTFTCTDCGHTKIEKIDKVTTPSTADETLVIPMVILAVLSACGLAVTAVARKRASR